MVNKIQICPKTKLKNNQNNQNGILKKLLKRIPSQ